MKLGKEAGGENGKRSWADNLGREEEKLGKARSKRRSVEKVLVMHSDVENASIDIDHFAQHLRFSVGSRRSVHRDVSARFEHAGVTTLYAAPHGRGFEH